MNQTSGQRITVTLSYPINCAPWRPCNTTQSDVTYTIAFMFSFKNIRERDRDRMTESSNFLQ